MFGWHPSRRRLAEKGWDVMDGSLPAAAAGAVPDEPPEGVTDRLMWQLSWRLLTDHVQAADGFCLVCRPWVVAPCRVRYLALAGLRASTAGRCTEPRSRRVPARGRASVPRARRAR